MEDNKLTESELEKRKEELDKRERELDRKERKLNSLDEKVIGVKENIYSHINVSLKTMDRVVAVLAVVLVLCIAVGILTR